MLDCNEVANYGTVDKERSVDYLLGVLGIGKAQCLVWSVLSFIVYPALSELMVISMLIPYIRCEWDLTIWFETVLICSIFSFYALGGVIFGTISDKKGRRTILLGSTTILCTGVILSAMAVNKWQFLVARMVVGLCIGGNHSICIGFASEVTGVQYKEWGTTIMVLTLRVAKVFVVLVAYVLLNSVGWRWYVVIVAMPILIPLLILLFVIPESPRYLIASGDRVEAKKAIVKLFAWNGKEFPENTKIKVYENVTRGEFKDIFQSKFRKETILLSIMYFGNILIIYALIIFLPLALDDGFCGASKSKIPEHKCKHLAQSSLLSLIFITFAALVGIIVAVLGIKRFGRCTPMKILGVLVLLLTCMLYFCINTLVTKIIATFIVLGSSIYNLILWIVTTELYPTMIKNTATGFINFCGKSGGVLGMALVYVLYYSSPYLVVTMFVVASSLSAIAAFLWTIETKDTVCQDVIDDQDS